MTDIISEDDVPTCPNYRQSNTIVILEYWLFAPKLLTSMLITFASTCTRNAYEYRDK